MGAADRLQPGRNVDAHHRLAAVVDRGGSAARPLQGGVQEEVLVVGVVGSTITLDDPLVNAWASGDVVRPTFFGLFDGKIVLDGQWRHGIDRVSIDCYPGGEPPRDAGSAWATLGGIEVFTPRAGLRQRAERRPSCGRSTRSTSGAAARRSSGRSTSWRARSRPSSTASRRERTQLEQFFDRMKGRRTAFYLPTWEERLRARRLGAVRIVGVPRLGSALATDFGSIDYAVVNEGVAVCLTDGTMLYRRITDIARRAATAWSRSIAWGVALSTANVARISRMPFSRFASDEMTTSWRRR
jgi:hypothetical protein